MRNTRKIEAEVKTTVVIQLPDSAIVTEDDLRGIAANACNQHYETDVSMFVPNSHHVVWARVDAEAIDDDVEIINSAAQSREGKDG